MKFRYETWRLRPGGVSCKAAWTGSRSRCTCYLSSPPLCRHHGNEQGAIWLCKGSALGRRTRRGEEFVFSAGSFRLFHHIELLVILLSQVENRKRRRFLSQSYGLKWQAKTRLKSAAASTLELTNHTAVPSSFRSAPRYLRIPVSASITQCALFFEAAKQGQISQAFFQLYKTKRKFLVSTVVSQTRRLASRM